VDVLKNFRVGCKPPAAGEPPSSKHGLILQRLDALVSVDHPLREAKKQDPISLVCHP